MTIEIKNIIGTTNAISQSDGYKIYQLIEKHNVNDIVIDFNNINFLSTAFLNASIGRLAQMYSFDQIKALNFLYPEDKDVFRKKVERVLENAALGDYYDKIVDEASL